MGKLINEGEKRGRRAKVEMIIDVETITTFGKIEDGIKLPNAPYNVGMTIGRRDDVITQHQIGIKEFWEYPANDSILYYRDKFKIEEFDILFDKIENFVLNFLIPKIEMYGGAKDVRLWSFNSPFDKRSIVYTLRAKGKRKLASYIDKLDWFCLWEWSSNILKDNKKFINWAIENEHKYRNNKFISEKGNLRTNAEIVYCYMTQNPEFEEVHKGMEDTTIEFAILSWCKKSKIPMKVGTEKKGGNWQIVNKCSGFLFKLEELIYGKNKKMWNEMVEEANSIKAIDINDTRVDDIMKEAKRKDGVANDVIKGTDL